MTGKRFEWCGDGIDMWDNQKEERIDSIDFEEAFNELSDENEQLRTTLKELKEIGDYQADRIKELSNENEQLKYHLAETEKELQEYKEFMSLE